MQPVKAPTSPLGVPLPTWAESIRRPWAYLARGRGRRALLACTLLLAARPACAARSVPEPLTDWLAGLGDAAQALAGGQADASAAAARRAFSARPRGAAGARAQAALGLALAEAGRPSEAAEALEVALAPAIAPARPHLAFLRGQALLASGEPHAAARLLEQAGADLRLAVARRARFLAGEALVEAGLPAEAVATLDAALRAWPTDPAAAAARLALGRALRAAGDEARAAETWRALWLEADLPEARGAGELLAAWRAAGGPVPLATADDHLARAERLVATARPDDALQELAAAREADPEVPAGRVEVLRAAALVGLGRHAEAARVAAPFADDPDPRVQRSARLALARAAARAGRVDEASRRYREVAASDAPIAGLPEWRQRDLGDEAAYLAAWLHYDAGDYRRAAAELDAFARAYRRTSRRVDEALWFAAWSRYRLGRTADAARAFARLSRGPFADAAAYWQGRLAKDARRGARLLRAAAAGADPWYALLARARLEAAGIAAAPPAASPARPLPDAAPAAAAGQLAVAVELMGLGLEDEGLDELRQLARGGAARAAAPLVAQLAAHAGDAELPFRMARDFLGQSARTLRWSHPEPYPELLPARARAFGVDPALVLAVMRRESSFRRAVRSGAGAEGLLQLRPVTAERLAALLGVPGGVGDRLDRPEVNVALGAHYLALLGARFADPAVVLAAYNAGPGPASDWARSRAGMPLDAWVECIPYRETRQYVKVVLSDWDVYRRLSGGPAAPIDPARPVAAPAPGVGF
ncbi:Lytic transglycosylase catalytic [Anaeromyxobacter dehalogenans 2CP-1]|uniref:Lytic transglycosylase catalytic n=1 Tax=Anaeromyxobacter dehalogenans (strain ATCC BAA-258 / DSM 21875 / 2CP-1) TaxID=455488 RepID=B8JB59_ANAD2|nr:lytic transglycosylase domain-containing protein [Anaeromyxobacter dehalogenans]ACL65686.1 Lytic transglycosylase catalytic [Anaeromyxobacter dehalogenans 2CP-1]